MADDLVARLRATGQGPFGSAMSGAAAKVRSVGTAASSAGATTAASFARATTEARSFGRASQSAGLGMRHLAALAGGVSLAATFREAVGAGVAFNRMQDSQRVGFTIMLRSGDKARSMMRQIQALALQSPVLDPGTAGEAARSLLAFGVPLKNVLGDVKRLGDMSAATGRSVAETMPLGARAFGQIASKGKLQMEEMNQLAEGVGLSQTAIRKQLGMTADEFAATFTPGNAIPASKALPAIRRAMEAQSKGAAKALSKTPAGQIAAAKERGALIAGSLTRPLYDRFGKAAGDLSERVQGIWTTKTGKPRRDLSLEEKLGLTRQAIRRVVEPLEREFSDFWRREHVGDRLDEAINAATPKVLNAASGLATKAAGAFVRGWWHASPWTKLITAGFLISKMGAFRVAGGMAADMFIGRYQRRMGAKGVLGGAGIGRRFGRAFGIAAAAAATVELAIALSKTDFIQGLADKIGVALGVVDPKDVRDRRDRAVKRAADRARRTRKHPIGEGPTGPAIVIPDAPRERRPRRPRARTSTSRPQRTAGGVPAPPTLHLEVPVKIGERELGRAFARIGTNDLARK